MNKLEWINEAKIILEKVSPGWDDYHDYADTLYQVFVIENDDDKCTPSDAICEDVAHWDN